MKTEVSLTELKEFFLKAMAQGWAAGARSRKRPDGYEEILYAQREMNATPLYLHDRWCGSDGNYAGTTTILLRENPVWVMQYYGTVVTEDQAEITAFLKRALHKAFKDGEFRGGRGPAQHTEGKYSYSNNCDGSSLSAFKGGEIITECRDRSKIVAGCVYQGGVVSHLLVSLD